MSGQVPPCFPVRTGKAWARRAEPPPAVAGKCCLADFPCSGRHWDFPALWEARMQGWQGHRDHDDEEPEAPEGQPGDRAGPDPCSPPAAQGFTLQRPETTFDSSRSRVVVVQALGKVAHSGVTAN